MSKFLGVDLRDKVKIKSCLEIGNKNIRLNLSAQVGDSFIDAVG